MLNHQLGGLYQIFRLVGTRSICYHRTSTPPCRPAREEPQSTHDDKDGAKETWGSDLNIQRESTRNGQTHRKRDSLLLRFPPHRGGFDGGNLTSSQPDRLPGPGSQMALSGTAVRDL